MATYLSLLNGQVVEVQASNATPSSASLSFTSPHYERAATITDATVTPSSTLSVVSITPVGDVDELEFDQLQCMLAPGSGSFTAYVQAIPGPVFGNYTLKYVVS